MKKKVQLSEEDKKLADAIKRAAKKGAEDDDFPTDDEILLLRLD